MVYTNLNEKKYIALTSSTLFLLCALLLSITTTIFSVLFVVGIISTFMLTENPRREDVSTYKYLYFMLIAFLFTLSSSNGVFG